MRAASDVSVAAALDDEWRLYQPYAVAPNIEAIACPFCGTETWQGATLRHAAALQCPGCPARFYSWGMAKLPKGGAR